MKRPLMFASIILSVMALWAQQPDRAIAVKADMQPSAQEARVALVIGNSAYEGAVLKNPANDARSMKEVLENCRFEVTLLTDADKQQMEEAISGFGQRIKGGAVGLFYFAGHGMQIQGENFLIPIGARLNEEVDIKYQGVNLGQILDRMDAARNPLNILILDACRNNPFARSWHRGGGSLGLASVDAPAGTVVAFATKPGSTAADGSGDHGTYTGALLAQLREPGLKLDDLFNKVGAEVIERSGKLQTPWLNSSPHQDFYFRPITTKLAGPSQAELEATYWEGIQNSRAATEFEAYLQRFPGGAHSELAHLKRKAILSAATPDLAGHPTPEPALKRDPLETRDEYAARIAGLGPLPAGKAQILVEQYDIDTRRLRMPIVVDPWAQPYLHQTQVWVEVDRNLLRQAIASGAYTPLALSFRVKDGVLQPGDLMVRLGGQSLPAVHEEPPVAVTTTRNPQLTAKISKIIDQMEGRYLFEKMDLGFFVHIIDGLGISIKRTGVTEIEISGSVDEFNLERSGIIIKTTKRILFKHLAVTAQKFDLYKMVEEKEGDKNTLVNDYIHIILDGEFRVIIRQTEPMYHHADMFISIIDSQFRSITIRAPLQAQIPDFVQYVLVRD